MKGMMEQPPERGPVTCPHCDGDGEEPGAPLDLEGQQMCSICHGEGKVSVIKAHRYEAGVS